MTHVTDTLAELTDVSRSGEEEMRRSGHLTGRTYERLADLTSELIAKKRSLGELRESPYAPIRCRRTPRSARVADYIRDRTVLVTGAAGTVGTALADALLELQPRRLVVLDRARERLESLHAALTGHGTGVEILQHVVDVSDSTRMAELFRKDVPQVVFHLAAQREPATAERELRDAILSNVLGSQTVTSLSGRHGVETYVHASTGKCRLLYDDRVYPATKKLAEVATKIVADESRATRFGLVRFHHVIDNSIVERAFRDQIARGAPLTVHLPPARKKHGQNLDEAVAMLLNAGVYAQRGEIFGSTRQTDYFSILDLALYMIYESGARVPILFTTPATSEGYSREDYPGTWRLDDPQCITHSFNVLETGHYMVFPEVELVSADSAAFDSSAARSGIDALVDCARASSSSSADLRSTLFQALYRFAQDAATRAPVALVLAALIPGISPEHVETALDLSPHLPTIRLLVHALTNRPASDIAPLAPQLAGALARVETFAELRAQPELSRTLEGLKTQLTSLAGRVARSTELPGRQ